MMKKILQFSPLVAVILILGGIVYAGTHYKLEKPETKLVAVTPITQTQVDDSVTLGDGNINPLDQWKSDGTNITQRTASKPIKLTGLESLPCLGTNGSGILGTGTCTGGSGGTGNVSTSSAETSTYIPFWTSTGATPALLSGGTSNLTWNGSKLFANYASTTAITSTGSAYFATSGGNVGIGTTAPNAGLHITRNYVDTLNQNLRLSGNVPGISFEDTTSSGNHRNFAIINDYSNNGLLEFNYSATAGGNPTALAFKIDGVTGNTLFAGNVGIGNTAPRALLDIGKDVVASAASLTAINGQATIGRTGSTGYGALEIGANGANYGWLQYADTNTGGRTVYPLVLNPLGGNVGIGTTSPAQLLSVAGNTYITGGLGVGVVNTAPQTIQIDGSFPINLNATTGKLDIWNGRATFKVNAGTVNRAEITSDNGIQLTTGSGLGVVIPNGNLGIGTTSPANQLEVYSADPRIVAKSSSASANHAAGLQVDATAQSVNAKWTMLTGQTAQGQAADSLSFFNTLSATNPLLITTAGNIGIGTTSPYSMLSVAGQVVAKNYIATSTTATSTFNGNVLISPTNDQSGFAYGGQLLKLVDTQASAPVQVVTQNKSTGASALSSFTLGNSNTTFPSNPFLASYYGGMYLASANWNTAGFNGLKPNGLAVFASDGDVSIGSASSNSASSSIRFFVGGNNGGGCTTFDSCGQDAVIAGGTAFLGLGTSTPKWRASIYATTSPQLALLGQNTDNIWTLRGIGNSFYIATSSPTTYATSTSPAFSINANGQLRNPFLKSCDTIDTDANGNMTCGTDSGGSSATATTTWKSLSQAWVYPDVTGSEACKAPAEYADGRRIHTLKMEYFSLNSSGDIYTLSATSTPYACNGYSSANATSTINSSTEQFVTVSGNATSFAGLMGSTAKQTTFINTVIAMATSTTFTGVELDIEGYASWSQANTTLYYTFLDNLGKRLHQYGKKLMVDVPPVWNSSIQSSGSGDEWDTANSTNYYKLRYEEFNNIAVDYIVIMAYDYHFDYGGGSSMAPLKWVDEIITFAQSKIQDNDKIVIGMPGYGYYDTTGGFAPTAQTYDQMTLLTGFGTATRDSTSGEMKWTNAGSSYVYNDATSLLIKRDAIEKRGIRRISVWHLGGNQWFTAGSRIELGNLSAPIVPLWFSPFASTTYATTTIFTPLNVAIGTTSANSTYSATFSVKGVMGAITAIVQFFTTSGTKVMEILDSGIVNLLGQWNFGDATSLEVPNGSALVFNQVGQVGFGTTDNDILIATTTANTPVVIPTMQKLWSATIASTSVDFVSGGRIPLPDLRDGYIIKEIYCHVESGTSVVINLDTSAGGANTDTVTCATTQTSDTAMSANYTLSAGSIMDLEIGTITGAVDYVTFSVYGVKIRE